ncbi:RNA-binding transcriptional accessory protein [Corynebacterium sp. 13CS0277]|uniref:Tex family protein n=1 Tax=Corynebacterium sp. 13CS0277 TaxID=2071994 RepID=UPI000D027E13|nr:Tex family protein [Corynebacterium sp. 13CS0277]PRQ12552.1 RNA-binding transcriptional accessory protein [Corynebacterium sp. 13CS0277]
MTETTTASRNFDVAAAIAAEAALNADGVRAALELLAEGNTVPFIARYRKEKTGGLDDTQLRFIEERAEYLRDLHHRKETVLAAIEEQGKLTAKLRRQIEETTTKARLEDLYLPFKKRRRTKADIAREAGIEPLVDELINQPQATPEDLAARFITKDFADAAAVLEGARNILVDRVATDADVVGEVRDTFFATGHVSAQVIDGKEKEGEKFADYFHYDEPFTKLPSHRILALLRGEKDGVLRLNFAAGDELDFPGLIARRADLAVGESPWLADAVNWAWRTKLSVSAGLDTRMRLKEAAEEGALKVFATNLRDVLLAAPAGQRATMGLDPGYRNGVKVAVVDATGKVLDTTIVYPHQPQKQWDQAAKELAMLAAKHGVQLLAVGNGTASRETMTLAQEVAELIVAAGGEKPTPVTVSESGASVYSASKIAAEEFPDMDVSLRGAVSIARRLQDPLAELVKIDPKSIGVGQYQHDVNQTHLARTLDAVVEDAVNAVGVDVNTASVALLSRVAGISATLAGNIVAYRDDNGAFRTRKELQKVPRLGPKAFEQSAGFLRIMGGEDPLDSSAVHPEAYDVVRRIAAATGLGVGDLIGNTRQLHRLNPADFADEQFGVPTVTDILAELDKPGRDPRPEFATATFAEGVHEVADVTPGMILEGTVTNVAAFGAFVDIGVHQDGLVHVSHMSRQFVQDPHTIVRSGDVVKVKVIDVDVDRRRIGLSLLLDDEAEGSARGSKPRGGRGKARGEGSSTGGERRGGGSRGGAQGRPRGDRRRGGRGAQGGSEAAGGALAQALRDAGLR